MMKKAFIPHLLKGAGFTLLELVVVIIILGVLATLGLTQYGSMVERGRQAEARQIFGDIRKLGLAYRLANGTVTGMTNADANIGTAEDQIPRYCRSSHYFSYNIEYGRADPLLDICASRCASNGKEPQRTRSYWICLVVNFSSGTDTWQTDF